MKLPPYVNQFRDRHGNRRVYFRRNGESIPLPKKMGTAAFNAAYADALKKSEQQKRVPSKDFGTMSGLIDAYYRSADYKSLSSSTRRTYEIELKKIRNAHGEKRIADLRRRHVYQTMDDLADNPTQANKALRFIGMIMRFALRRGFVESDPTAGVKCLPTHSDGFRDWPETLISQYEIGWQIGTVARLAFDLALFTGQRRADVVKMHRNHIIEGCIDVRQSKTGARLKIPIHPNLMQSIEATRRTGLYLIETQYGRPFSAKGFGNRFSGWARAAGIPAGFSIHGLRKSCCRRLAEAGCSAHEITAISGHLTLREAERYTKAASQKILAESAFARTEQKRKPTNPENPVYKPSNKILKNKH